LYVQFSDATIDSFSPPFHDSTRRPGSGKNVDFIAIGWRFNEIRLALTEMQMD